MRANSHRRWWRANPFHGRSTQSYADRPSLVLVLLLVNAAFFVAEGLFGAYLFEWFALWPVVTSHAVPGLGLGEPIPGFWPWQLVSYAFLHGNLLHLLFNMFALWMFGTEMELAWGSRRLGIYYFVCVVGAGLVQLLVASMASRHGYVYPTVGASGGVFGLLLAFGMTFPDRIVVLLFPPIPMKAKWLAVGFGAIELLAGVTGMAAGIAHFAHLGGMLFGYLLIRYWRARWPRARG